MPADVLNLEQDEEDEQDAFELDAPGPGAPPSPSAAQAFSAAEIASKATAAVVSASNLTPQALAERLCSLSRDGPPIPVPDRLAACHRINEHFAACSSFEAAVDLAGRLCSTQPTIVEALVALMTDGDVLVELAVQLMHNLCLHDAGAQRLVSSGALPVLTASLRADEPLLRAHGLQLLATLAERRDMVKPLVRAGVVRLVCFLGRTLRGPAAAAQWPLLLEICEGLLRVPTAIPTAQHKMLRTQLGEAALLHKCRNGQTEDLVGTLPLEMPDARRLTRLLVHSRAIALAADPAAARAGAGTGGAGPGATGTAAAGAACRTGEWVPPVASLRVNALH